MDGYEFSCLKLSKFIFQEFRIEVLQFRNIWPSNYSNVYLANSLLLNQLFAITAYIHWLSFFYDIKIYNYIAIAICNINFQVIFLLLEWESPNLSGRFKGLSKLAVGYGSQINLQSEHWQVMTESKWYAMKEHKDKNMQDVALFAKIVKRAKKESLERTLLFHQFLTKLKLLLFYNYEVI